MAQLSGLPATSKTRRWLGYGLMLGMPNRSQLSLQQVLADYFSLNLTVRSKALSKYQLSEECWTRLGLPNFSEVKQSELRVSKIRNSEIGYVEAEQVRAQNNRLGQGFLLGRRCWLSRQKIIITVKPESAVRLKRLIKSSAWYQEMADMSRYYLRDKTEIAIYLKAPDSWFERLQLSSQTSKTVRLGRGFQLKSSRQNKTVVYLIHLEKD